MARLMRVSAGADAAFVGSFQKRAPKEQNTARGQVRDILTREKSVEGRQKGHFLQILL